MFLKICQTLYSIFPILLQRVSYFLDVEFVLYMKGSLYFFPRNLIFKEYKFHNYNFRNMVIVPTISTLSPTLPFISSSLSYSHSFLLRSIFN